MPRLRRPSEKLAAKTSQFAGRGSAFLAAKWDQGIKTVKQPLVKTVLQGENGGKLDEHWYRFKALYASGAEVEIRGKCQSACPLGARWLLGRPAQPQEHAMGDRPLPRRYQM
jgi:hypothetical protein